MEENKRIFMIHSVPPPHQKAIVFRSPDRASEAERGAKRLFPLTKNAKSMIHGCFSYEEGILLAHI